MLFGRTDENELHSKAKTPRIEMIKSVILKKCFIAAIWSALSSIVVNDTNITTGMKKLHDSLSKASSYFPSQYIKVIQ